MLKLRVVYYHDDVSFVCLVESVAYYGDGQLYLVVDRDNDDLNYFVFADRFYVFPVLYEMEYSL